MGVRLRYSASFDNSAELRGNPAALVCGDPQQLSPDLIVFLEGLKKVDEDAAQGKTVTSKHTELRDGNSEYLKRVEWCITKRCELLKLNPPQRLEHGGSAELPPIQTETRVELTRAQRFVRLASLLADAGVVPPDRGDGSRPEEAPGP
jgi:hypothetical protein